MNFVKGNEKSSGIELFRIISMLMIVILHINMKGGLMGCFPKVDGNYIALWFGESTCFACVNCFALISGYVMVGKRLKPSRVTSLYLQVFSISAVVATIFLIWFSEGVELTKITDGYMPLLKSQYWYFTAYFGMMFFIPIMNSALDKIERKTLKKCVIIIIFLLSVVSTFDRKDLFKHGNGYSTLWLCVMYITGGYFGKFGIDTKKYSIKKSALYAIICSITISTWIIIHSYNVGIETGTVTGQFDYLYYTNPVVVLQSIFMLLFFAQLDFKNKWLRKIIFFFSASAFSVYLIHVQPLIFDLVFVGSFRWLGDFDFFTMSLLVILCAMGVYIVCTLLDKLRLLIFKAFRINDFAKFSGDIINKALNALFKLL